MILIFSLSYDHSTNEVVKWLNYYEIPYLRINYLNEFNNIVYINSETIKLTLCGIELKCITAVWFRRTPEFIPQKFKNKTIAYEINKILISEYQTVYSHVVDQLKSVFWLNHPKNSSLNKLSVLNLAKRIGLLVPETFLLNNKKDLQNLLQVNELITKPIYEVAKLNIKNKLLITRTTEITDVNLFPDTFFISKFQKKIDKNFEIRSVFLMGKFYSMSIHSQQNEKTKIDFRNYDFKYPNRCCPIKLPKRIESKLKKIMFELNLNFGSIDLILDKWGNFYFLEINPVGQFGMTSTPNNYLIEKQIAKLLIVKSQ